MISEIRALGRLSSWQVKNKLLFGLRERPLMNGVLWLLIGLFVYGYWRLAYWLVEFIYFQDVFGVLLASKLVHMLLYLAIGISLVSSLTTAMTHLYLSKDLEFHFSLPVNFNVWVCHRFFQVFVQSTWMLLLFGGPLIWLFLTFSGNSIPLRILGLGVFALLASFPIFLATLACMVLVKLFPARRVHQVFLVFTVVLVSSLVLLFRYLEPERFIGPGGLTEFRGFVDLVNLDAYSWNPANWAYYALIALSQQQWDQLLRPLLSLGGTFSVLMGTFLVASHKLYRASWDRALQSLSGEADITKQRKRPGLLSRLLGHRRVSQEAREILLFIRDPSQWSQVFVLSALMGLCLFSVTRLPLKQEWGTNYHLALLGMTMVDFICLSIASRFVFTSFSADGQAIWLMKTAPEGWLKFMRSKLLIYGVPTVMFAIMMMLGAALIMKLPESKVWLLMGYTLWDALMLVLLTTALGMLFINPGVENPIKMIVSPGGVLLMSSGFFLSLLHVFLRLSAVSAEFNQLLSHIGWPDMQDGQATFWFSLVIGVEALALFGLLRLGLRTLQRGDFL